MAGARSRSGPIICGFALMLVGAASALGLHLVEQGVLQRSLTLQAPSRAESVRAARHAADVLFPSYHVLALYAAATPVRVMASKDRSTVSREIRVLMVLGQDGKAALVAQDAFFPYSPGQWLGSGDGWEIPFPPAQGPTVEMVRGRSLTASLRGRVAGWLRGDGLATSADSVFAWPFPSGTLVDARYRNRDAAVLFPAKGAPRVLQSYP